jgi:carboxyl-terminal processing protease
VKLGILSNDRIIRINDSSAIGLTTPQASVKLRGPKGTKVSVTIARPGETKPLVYEITRDNIALNSIDASLMLPDDIGLVSVNKFSATTKNELSEALKKLKGQGMKRLMLDLRGNPGGYLEQAELVADLFIDGGPANHPRKIVYTKARTPELEEEYLAKSGDEFEKLPIIVLVNNGSASASEIVAGAIQDCDRGLIVGETSFGKGLVQHQWNLSDGSSLRLTIARYYTPSGRLIQRSYEGKDFQEYRDEVYNRNEKEGDNVGHTRDAANDSTRPKFYTESHRVVYGGGGITPDYIVKPLDIAEATKDLLRRDAYYPFITGYIDREGQSIRAKYSSGYRAFVKEYELPNAVVNDFRASLEKKGIKITEEAFDKDRVYHKARLKAYIARGLWGEEGWTASMVGVDTQLQKALTLFPEAQKIAGLEAGSKGKKLD